MCHHWCRQSYSLGPLLSELALGRHSGGECSPGTTKQHNISQGLQISPTAKLALVISALIDILSNLADKSFNPMEDTMF